MRFHFHTKEKEKEKEKERKTLNWISAKTVFSPSFHSQGVCVCVCVRNSFDAKYATKSRSFHLSMRSNGRCTVAVLRHIHTHGICCNQQKQMRKNANGEREREKIFLFFRFHSLLNWCAGARCDVEKAENQSVAAKMLISLLLLLLLHRTRTPKHISS